MTSIDPNTDRQHSSLDFAVAGVFGNLVVLEANEWDFVIGSYRVVTVYLDPGSAEALAQQLALCAGATQQDHTAPQ